MKDVSPASSRRNFMKTSAAISAGLFGLKAFASFSSALPAASGELFMIGPMEGYTPQVGTLVSMLNYNRQTVIDAVKGLSMEQLDHLHDPEANTIGALILHLGATEKYYQINTFEGRQDFSESEKKMWEVPMGLGDEGRKKIKGQEVDYYLERIQEVRQLTLEELKKKDDDWLLAVDPEWSAETPLNTYWKWFHVCEHESNHRGQITWLKSRLP